MTKKTPGSDPDYDRLIAAGKQMQKALEDLSKSLAKAAVPLGQLGKAINKMPVIEQCKSCGMQLTTRAEKYISNHGTLRCKVCWANSPYGQPAHRVCDNCRNRIPAPGGVVQPDGVLLCTSCVIYSAMGIPPQPTPPHSPPKTPPAPNNVATQFEDGDIVYPGSGAGVYKTAPAFARMSPDEFEAQFIKKEKPKIKIPAPGPLTINTKDLFNHFAEWFSVMIKDYAHKSDPPPWTFDMDGEVWTATSNGVAVVGLRDDPGLKCASPETDNIKNTKSVLKPVSRNAQLVTFSKLKNFVQPIDRLRFCKFHGGRCSPDVCDSLKHNRDNFKWFDKRMYGRILGMPVDVGLLRAPFAYLPGTHVFAEETNWNGNRAIVIQDFHDRWRLGMLCLAIRTGNTDDQVWPRFAEKIVHTKGDFEDEAY